jgi:hypothetical protein
MEGFDIANEAIQTIIGDIIVENELKEKEIEQLLRS